VSKRDPLRTLGKRFPPPTELKAIYDSLDDHSHRSLAIVSSSILEGMLEKLLIASLQDKDPSLVGRLFRQRGAFSDFDSKINVAQAFGILKSDICAELHRIKGIRNVFAHAASDINFSNNEN